MDMYHDPSKVAKVCSEKYVKKHCTTLLTFCLACLPLRWVGGRQVFLISIYVTYSHAKQLSYTRGDISKMKNNFMVVNEDCFAIKYIGYTNMIHGGHGG